MISFPNRLRRHLTYANVMATLAVFLVVSGGTAVAARALINGRDLKNDSVTGAKVKNGSLAAADLSAASRRTLKGQKGAAGERGAQGERGPQGDRGAQGERGPAGRDGTDLAAGSVGTSLLADGSVTGPKLAAVPRVELKRSGALALPDGTLTDVPWDDELSDPLDLHAPSGTGVTVDRPGLWLIEGGVRIFVSGDRDGQRAVEFLKNGSGVVMEEQAAAPFGVADSSNHITVSRVVRLVAGDTVSVRAYQDSGSAGNVYGGAAAESSFAATWIGN